MNKKQADFRVGTSGWSYPASGEGSWNGVFYLPGKVDELSYYAERFNTVEINTSFYRFPIKNKLKGWYNKTPKGFLFTLKANRMITHLKKLKGTEELLSSFYSLADLLEEEVACILFQMPPSLTKEKHVGTLKGFLKPFC
jgi:uncharacterized protein YecE (DUF72 family)